MTPSEVYYNSPHWRALRKQCLDRDHHTCTVEGCGVTAHIADHIKTRPQVSYPTPLDVIENLRSLCRSHDSQVKEHLGQRKQRGEFKVKGCDSSGRSLDPNHSWNRSS